MNLDNNITAGYLSQYNDWTQVDDQSSIPGRRHFCFRNHLSPTQPNSEEISDAISQRCKIQECGTLDALYTYRHGLVLRHSTVTRRALRLGSRGVNRNCDPQ